MVHQMQDFWKKYSILLPPQVDVNNMQKLSCQPTETW